MLRQATLASRGTYWAHRVVDTFVLCFLEARPSVQAIFLLRFLAAPALAGRMNALGVLSGAVVWLFATMFVYLFNGAMDATEDTLNGSRRPIARGALDPALAARTAFACGGVSLVGASMLGVETLLLVTAFLALGYAYSAGPLQLKRTAGGTVLVVVLGGIGTYQAGFVASGGGFALPVVVLAVAMSLWMGLVGAITKDFSDVAGDLAAERRTGVIAWGESRARLLVASSAVLVGAGFLAAAELLADRLLPPAIILLAGAVWLGARVLIGSTVTSRSRRRAPYRVFMVTQYAVHVAVIAEFFGYFDFPATPVP